MGKWRMIIACYTMAIMPVIILQFRFASKHSFPQENNFLRSKQDQIFMKDTKQPSRKITEMNPNRQLNLSIVESFKKLTDHHLVNFDHERDWLVFLHIQKTSGTNLDMGIVKHVMVSKNGTRKKGCTSFKVIKKVLSKFNDKFINRTVKTTEHECKRPAEPVSWYISWHDRSFGWSCGLHSGLSDMQSCLLKRFPAQHRDSPLENFHFITILRSPIKRYISEWLHVMRTGSVWVFESKPASKDQNCSYGNLSNYSFYMLKTICQTSNFTLKEHFKNCLAKNQTSWKGVSLKNFAKCKYNLAANRQTRMLALYDSDFTVCDYLQSPSRQRSMQTKLLERAKKGLESLSFFGLTEFQNYTLLLFNKMFNGTLSLENTNGIAAAGQRNPKVRSPNPWFALTIDALAAIGEEMLQEIQDINRLDLLLYDYAKALFFKRLSFYNIAFNSR